MAYMLAVFALVVFGLIASAGAYDVPPITDVPGDSETSFMMYVDANAFTKAGKPYIQQMETYVKSLVIEDTEDTVTTSIGKINYSITNIDIQIFDLGGLYGSTNPTDQVLTLVFSDNQFKLSFDYAIQMLSFPYSSESGSGSVSTDSLSISGDVKSKRVPESGGIDLTIFNIIVDVGNFTIDMNGGLVANIMKSLESVFSVIVNDVITAMLKNIIEDTLYPYLDRINEKGFYVCNPEISCLDYRLTRDVDIVEGGFFVSINGTMYNGDHLEENPPLEYSYMNGVMTPYELNVELQGTTFQSMLNTFQLQGFFNLWNPNTNSFNPTEISYESIVAYFPKWAEAYPQGTNGYLSITTSDFPTSQILYNGLKIQVHSYLQLVPVNQEDTTFYSSNIDLTLLGDVYWRFYHYTHEEIIDGTGMITLDFTYVSSSIENADISKEWLENIIKEQYLKYINQKISDQMIHIFSLPEFVYTDQKVTYNTDYVMINANFYFNENQ